MYFKEIQKIIIDSNPKGGESSALYQNRSSMHFLLVAFHLMKSAPWENPVHFQVSVANAQHAAFLGRLPTATALAS